MLMFNFVNSPFCHYRGEQVVGSVLEDAIRYKDPRNEKGMHGKAALPMAQLINALAIKSGKIREGEAYCLILDGPCTTPKGGNGSCLVPSEQPEKVGQIMIQGAAELLMATLNLNLK